MPNANIELLVSRKSLFRYFKASPLLVLLRFSPRLVDKICSFQPTERLLEYPFIHENMPFNGGSKILDVGSGSSFLPLELASKGYQVWSIDLIRGLHHSIKHGNLTFVQGDIRETTFPDAFFDSVTAISSIEHIGLGGSETNLSGDKDAIQEIFRVLKPEGNFLITVPFGKAGIYTYKGHALFRVYDYSSLKKLLEGFEIEKRQLALLEEAGWTPASLEEPEGTDSLSQPRWYSSKAVAMVVARKPLVMEGARQ